MRRQRDIKLAVSIFMAIALALFLPGLGMAGSLEPSGPPAPTMKTLDQIPPTWDQVLPASDRFVLVMSGDGVLDKETGLVWEKSPSQVSTLNWHTAQSHCNDYPIAGRVGWRLPTIQEFASLIDPTVPSPTLPSGHPFSNVHSDVYWSATSDASNANNAWFVWLISGTGVGGGEPKTNSHYVWCVRGGSGVDAQ
jgi:hypothetical protein